MTPQPTVTKTPIAPPNNWTCGQSRIGPIKNWAAHTKTPFLVSRVARCTSRACGVDSRSDSRTPCINSQAPTTCRTATAQNALKCCRKSFEMPPKAAEAPAATPFAHCRRCWDGMPHRFPAFLLFVHTMHYSSPENIPKHRRHSAKYALNPTVWASNAAPVAVCCPWLPCPRVHRVHGFLPRLPRPSRHMSFMCCCVVLVCLAPPWHAACLAVSCESLRASFPFQRR